MPEDTQTPITDYISTKGSETLGYLLQAYGRRVGFKTRRSIQVLRRERLRSALHRAGLRLSEGAVSVLADGLAKGRLAVTDTDLYLINDGGAGVHYTCSCTFGFGACSVPKFGPN